MRKVKLQMQVSVDGFVAGPNEELDWMVWNWDDELKEFVNSITDTSDPILLGRKMTDGFVNYWTNVVKNQPDSPEFTFAKKMIDKPKVVFTKTIDKSNWDNTTLATGNLADEITRLKQQPGQDILVYGGSNFVSNLIQQQLIDEYYLFINPVALGSGKPIFNGRTNLQLVQSQSFSCGVVCLFYQPKKEQ